MALPVVFVDIDQSNASVQARVGQTVVLIRRSTLGGKWLRVLTLPPSHFAMQPVQNHGLTPLPGQPANTHIVGIATAVQSGSGGILVQFSPPNPMVPAYPPSSIPFVVQ